ncbi:EthD family reductase [Jiulongibacter sediminis]|uniref:EthD family reductase n=1 Tax=Jiulongibacter sediminis TaxID=1605367 RepID=UPI0006DC0AC1|nr:EthD family reductase [Jiulongibacter sediminis]TBX22378.1 ethyl tert-butyl ether degradation protein EthD [Jiulongibacter sediminis]
MKLKAILLFFFLTSLNAFSQQSHSDEGLFKIAIMYPNAEGNTFNIEYYKTKHMPYVAAMLGSNLIKYTIEEGLSNVIPGQPLPYMAIGTFYVKNVEDYQKAIGPNITEIRADFANYTNAIPVILISEVVY